MSNLMARTARRARLRTAAAATTLALAAFSASGVRGQTLTDPNPPAKWTPPRAVAKAHPAAAQKSCSGYGAGFVRVPGTDACVKVGGWVTVEGSGGR